MFTPIWFSRKVFGLFLLSLAVSACGKKLAPFNRRLAHRRDAKNGWLALVITASQLHRLARPRRRLGVSPENGELGHCYSNGE